VTLNRRQGVQSQKRPDARPGHADHSNRNRKGRKIMPPAVRFETPENVQVHYEPAGLGTRFLAWFVDQILLWFAMFLVFVAMIAAGVSFEVVFEGFDDDNPDDRQRAVLYFFGLMMLAWGLGSFVYFACCELLLRGQTIGKRVSNIRVVKAGGFQLDAASILVRNVFRVADHLPPLWIIPAMSRLSQRAGDMVAGTVVVCDAPTELSSLRATLAARAAADAQFRFDQSLLKRLSGHDFQAIERMLDRWPDLPAEQQAALLDKFAEQIAKKLRVEPPPADQQMRFLEDVFAAELRRQDRSLV
jgi:uncharacterized RDD family membrane protein YckC